MKIDLNRIITKEEILNEIDTLEERLLEGELIIFQKNKPIGVIVGIDDYESLIEKVYYGEKVSKEDDEEDLENLLRKIGKQVFVDYYFTFKNSDNPEDSLPDEFTINSKKSRTSTAKKIFRIGKNIEALDNIMNSDRLELSVREKAREIKLKEIDGKLIEEVPINNDNEIKVKIGRYIRTVIRDLASKNKIPNEEVNKMTSADKSKEIFKSSIPVLKRLDSTKSKEEQKKDKRGYNRYYDEVFLINGVEYLLSSQWYENVHRNAFESWLKNLN